MTLFTWNNSAAEYQEKPKGYFSGARRAFVDDLPPNPQGRLLEIGCGNGDTAIYALETGKCGWCAGVELCPAPAALAARRLNDVVLGDIEQVELPYPMTHFDALIMSEVIEHLRDPWAVLKKLHPLLKPGAWVLAGSPNVSHYSVVRMLLAGQWTYSAVGIMDKTHLRWFTAASYRQLFEDCGYSVQFVGPASPLRRKARWLNHLTRGRLLHLLHEQIYLRATR